jgi:hypothetical protein
VGKYPEAIEAIEVYSLGDALQALFEGMVPTSKFGSIVEQCLLEDPAARPRLDFMLAELAHEVDRPTSSVRYSQS